MNMEVNELNKFASVSLGRKAWTAYISVLIVGILLYALLLPYFFALSVIAGAVASVVLVAFIIYRILLIRSFHLYFDSEGVWLYSGILPWNKGRNGVKWRDLDSATFSQSMKSWLFKSHQIQLNHRFTKSYEIVLTHWAEGPKVVETINHQHQKLVESASLS